MTPDLARASTGLELVRLWAEQMADRDATFHRAHDGRWIPTTWAQLWREVQQAAGAFSDLGLRPGDRMAIVARTCREWQIAELGAGLAGAVVVGIDAHAASDYIAWILGRIGAAVLVVDGPTSLARIPPALREHRPVLMFDAEAGSDSLTLSWSAALSKSTVPAGRVPAAPDPDSTATWIFTSGTTGAPKGIRYSHRDMMQASWAMADEFADLREARLVCWLPMSAMYQRMINLAAFASRSTTYFVEDPRVIIERLAEVRPTVFTSVPRFYERVHQGIQERLAAAGGIQKSVAERALRVGAEWARQVRAGQRPGMLLRVRHAVADRLVLRRMRAVMGGEIKWMFTGSAKTPIWLLEFFHSIGLLLLEGYALSENAVPVAANKPHDYRFGSVGKPFAMNAVRIGEGGEILVKSPVLARGYLGDDGPQPPAMDHEYRTGDLGHFDEDGFLYLTGRASELIKTSSGRRISPVAVEGVYAESRYIEQVVVVGNNRPHLVGLVSLNRSAIEAVRGGDAGRSGATAGQASASDLVARDFARLGAKLSRYERIQAFAVLGAPFTIEAGELTSTLKLRRSVIEARHADVIEGLYSGEGQQLAAGRASAGEAV